MKIEQLYMAMGCSGESLDFMKPYPSLKAALSQAARIAVVKPYYTQCMIFTPDGNFIYDITLKATIKPKEKQ